LQGNGVDARRFLDEMRTRLQEFALTLHPEKTRRRRLPCSFGLLRTRRDARCYRACHARDELPPSHR
jgi:hypothetical protein